ncbi:MAG: penicillin-binding protein 2 [Henriciella sp.]
MSNSRPVDAMFTRRALVAGGVGAAMFSGLIARLFQLQVLDRERYELAAAENGVKLELAPPRRGRILDRFGRPLATHRRAGRVYIVREQAGDVGAVLKQVARYIDLSPERQEAIIYETRRQASFRPVIVASELSYEDFATLSLVAPELPGLLVEMAPTRSYPRGRDFAHVLGYVGKANGDYIFNEAYEALSTSRPPALERALASEFARIRLSASRRAEFYESHPADSSDLRAFEQVYRDVSGLLLHRDMRVGRLGVEARAESYLRGEAGFRRLETNAAGRIIRELPSDDLAPKPGKDLSLTVDADLQKITIDRFGEESGAAVVMDVTNGDILAFVSTPAFDPNDFVNGISQSDYDMLRNNDRSPLYHKAYDGTYPPGSTFKMIVGIAALESGVTTPEERVTCNGRYRFGNNTWHCWRPKGHGPVNLHDAMKGSCDVYFYEMAKRIGIEKIASLAEEFGLGRDWELGLTGGRAGTVPNDAWKRERTGEPWYQGETLNVGIGQGQLSASPLQLAIMTARIATMGRSVNPRIIGLGPEVEASVPEMKAVDPAIMNRIRDSMFAVTSEPGGTALASGELHVDGLRMAGKTGTAQVRRISEAERRSGILGGEDLERRLRDHALFVAYAPHDAPKYAISVVVEHGEGGSTTAAPIARDILSAALAMDSARQANYMAASHSGDTEPDSGTV